MATNVACFGTVDPEHDRAGKQMLVPGLDRTGQASPSEFVASSPNADGRTSDLNRRPETEIGLRRDGQTGRRKTQDGQ